MSIVKRVGAGINAAIMSLNVNDAVAIKIPANEQTTRYLTIAASYLAEQANIESCYGRLSIWAQQEPVDSDIIYLEAISGYFGKVPGRPLFDTFVHVKLPFNKEMTFAVEATEDIWFYMPLARDGASGLFAPVPGLMLLSVIRRESDILGTQGLKAV